MKCKICHHAARIEIETIIAEGKTSVREIARRYGLGRGNVSRHTNHMPDAARRRVQRGAVFVEKAVEEAFEAAVETLRAHRREGKSTAALEAAAQVVKLAPSLLEQFERRREAEKKESSAKESRTSLIESISKLLPKVEPALVVGDAELLQRVLGEADPLLLLESLRIKLRLQPELRRRAAEACAEAVIGGFEYGQREQALAAFEEEHAALREKLFPAPAVPERPPVAEEPEPEPEKDVLPFKPPPRGGW